MTKVESARTRPTMWVLLVLVLLFCLAATGRAQAQEPASDASADEVASTDEADV